MSTRVADSVQSSMRHSELVQLVNLHSTARHGTMQHSTLQVRRPSQGQQHTRQVKASSTVEVISISASFSRHDCKVLKSVAAGRHGPTAFPRPSPCCIPGVMVVCLIGVVGPPSVVVQVTQLLGVVPEALVHLVPGPVPLCVAGFEGGHEGWRWCDRMVMVELKCSANFRCLAACCAVFSVGCSQL